MQDDLQLVDVKAGKGLKYRLLLRLQTILSRHGPVPVTRRRSAVSSYCLRPYHLQCVTLAVAALIRIVIDRESCATDGSLIFSAENALHVFHLIELLIRWFIRLSCLFIYLSLVPESILCRVMIIATSLISLAALAHLLVVTFK